MRWSLCVHVCVCTHTPSLLLQCALCLVRTSFIAATAEPSGLTHPTPPTHLPQCYSGMTHHCPPIPPLLLGEETMKAGVSSVPGGRGGGGGGLEGLLGGSPGGPRVPVLNLSQAQPHLGSLLLSPGILRCPAAAATTGVPGTPQPVHCAPPGPGPNPVLTCCSWGHEEPPRPAHQAPLHHR